VNFSGVSFSADIVTENGAALLGFEAGAAVSARPGRRPLLRLVSITEENRVPAHSRAIDLATAGNHVLYGLIQ
jgi:hypothetical protein